MPHALPSARSRAWARRGTREQRAHPGIALVPQAHQLDRFVDGTGGWVEVREQGDELADRQRGVQFALLQDEPDALAPRPCRAPRVRAEHRDVALGALSVALENLDRRGLPRAVGPQEAEDLAA